MIRSILFDLDDTLYDFTSAHAMAMNRLAAYAASTLGLSRERFDTLQREAFERQRTRLGGTAAVHNRLIRCQLMLEAAGKPIAHAPEMADLYWSTLTVGIGSNMTADWQYAKLKRLSLMAYVDFIVTSEEAGVEKPAAGFFQLCAEKAGHAPEECAFVGDSLRGDAMGALDAGMAAFWLCRDPEPADAPDGITRIQSLSELPALIESSH